MASAWQRSKPVAQVESAASGRDLTTNTAPRYSLKRTHFASTPPKVDLSHPYLSCRRASAKKYYWNQYSRLFSDIFDPVAAIKAWFVGKFRPGPNHNGWPDPVPQLAARCRNQKTITRQSFDVYCVTNGLIVHLKTKHWAKFC